MQGAVDPHAGWVIDFGNIKDACKPVHRPTRSLLPQRDPWAREPDQRTLAAWIWRELTASADDVCGQGIRNMYLWMCVFAGPAARANDATSRYPEPTGRSGIPIDEVGISGLRHRSCSTTVNDPRRSWPIWRSPSACRPTAVGRI